MSDQRTPVTADAAAFAKARAEDAAGNDPGDDRTSTDEIASIDEIEVEAGDETPVTGTSTVAATSEQPVDGEQTIAASSTRRGLPARRGAGRRSRAVPASGRAAVVDDDRRLRRLVPAASSFDLLDGEYRKTRTGRMLSVLSLGAATLVVLLVLGQYTRVSIEALAADNRVDELANEIAARTTQLNALSNFDGVDGVKIIDFVAGRSAEASLAVEGQPNLAALIADVVEALPDGTELSQFQMTAPAVSATAPRTGDSDSEAPTPTHTISITVLAEDYDAVERLIAAVRAIDGFANVAATWSGPIGDIRVSLNLSVPPGGSARFAVFAADASNAVAGAATNNDETTVDDTTTEAPRNDETTVDDTTTEAPRNDETTIDETTVEAPPGDEAGTGETNG